MSNLRMYSHKEQHSYRIALQTMSIHDTIADATNRIVQGEYTIIWWLLCLSEDLIGNGLKNSNVQGEKIPNSSIIGTCTMAFRLRTWHIWERFDCHKIYAFMLQLNFRFMVPFLNNYLIIWDNFYLKSHSSSRYKDLCLLYRMGKTTIIWLQLFYWKLIFIKKEKVTFSQS